MKAEIVLDPQLKLYLYKMEALQLAEMVKAYKVNGKTEREFKEDILTQLGEILTFEIEL